MSDKKPLFVIAGPTAVGKSALGVCLAEELNGEVISADSMQVYRHMDIGTAKITKTEMRNVLHHMIDVVDPTESFSVVDYAVEVKKILNGIYERGKVPIIVGGTGFYIQAVVYDIDFSEKGEDEEIRKELNLILKESGAQGLYSVLCELDPTKAGTLHFNDVKRVMRAIEFIKQTGEKLSDHNNEQRSKVSPFNCHYFALTDERSLIYERIDKRVDLMMANGLLEEINRLLELGCMAEMTSMQGIGYKQLLAYKRGEYDLEEAVRLIKRDSRHYAKRQLTWFNRESEVRFIDRRIYPDTASQIEFIKSFL